jgi:hypothetical protein
MQPMRAPQIIRYATPAMKKRNDAGCLAGRMRPGGISSPPVGPKAALAF